MSVWSEDFSETLDRSRGPSVVTWLVGATIGAFLIWANFAPLDEIVRADGSVVSGDRPQIVQNLVDAGAIILAKANMDIFALDASIPGTCLEGAEILIDEPPGAAWCLRSCSRPGGGACTACLGRYWWSA